MANTVIGGVGSGKESRFNKQQIKVIQIEEEKDSYDYRKKRIKRREKAVLVIGRAKEGGLSLQDKIGR